MPKVEFKDYYKTLEVDRKADEKAVRAAFRKLARKHHPDINPGDKHAEERFKDLNEAYEVLSDPDKRKLYDRYGEDWQRYKEAGFTGDEPQRGQTRQDFDDFGTWFAETEGGGRRFDFGGRSGSHSDFFETLFGGGRSAGFDTATRRPRRGQDLEAAVDVSFREAFQGTTRRFDIQSQDTCPTCQGSGLVRNTECPTCEGAGVVPKTRSIEVTIPPGVTTGSKIRVAGQGGAGVGDAPRGDVYLVVTVAPDHRFERDGDQLRTTVDVPLYNALLGGEVLVPTPTGQVALRIPEGTQQGRTFRLRGQGMPKLRSRNAERGDLLARINVTLPENLSEKERELIAQLRSIREGNSR